MVIFHAFFHCLLTFSKLNFLKKNREHYQSVKQLGSGSVPDRGPNCLQRLSADDKRRRYQGKNVTKLKPGWHRETGLSPPVKYFY